MQHETQHEYTYFQLTVLVIYDQTHPILWNKAWLEFSFPQKNQTFHLQMSTSV